MGFHGIDELQRVSGFKAKQRVLEKYADDETFKKFLYYALNPMITYNLSEKVLRKFPKSDAKLVLFYDIFECCEYLSRLRGIDDATLRQVQILLYIHTSKELRELFIKLLAKTVRLGVTAKTVNQIIPNLIPEWEVQQAFSIDKYPLPEGTEFWLTQKLNGVRATYYNGQLIARSGTPYKGLQHITAELSNVGEDIILDGELTLKDKGALSDNEAFRAATGIINSDNVNKTSICFTVFDCVTRVDFESANPKVNYSLRRDALDKLSATLHSNNVRILPVLYHGTDQSKIDELLEQMVSEDKEGLMVNTDVPYKRTRHRGILKVKRFYTMDLPIVKCEEGTGRLEGKLGAFVLDYKGNEVKVGSGFDDAQRSEFWNKRDELIGKLCEVKYKEISSDKKTGFESLQFPIFIGVRDDKSEVSYG